MRKFVLGLMVMGAASACGDDGGSKQVDGGVAIDGEIAVDAVINTPVTLTVTSAGVGLAGVRVHFQNPDSSLITSVDTNASGVATALMPNGGFVTAVNPFAQPGGVTAELSTFAGVKPGDELKLVEGLGGQVTDVTVTAPKDNDGTVTQYLFSTSCDKGTAIAEDTVTGPPQVLGLYGKCLPNTDIVVASLDTNNDIVHWLFAKDAAVTGTTLDLSASAITNSPTTKSYAFNNIPLGGNIEIIQDLLSPEGTVVELEGGGAGSNVTDTQKVPAFANAVDLVGGILDAPFGGHGLADWGPFTATHTVDVGARVLKEATSGASYDKTLHRVTWTEATTGQTGDFAISSVYTYRQAGALGIYWQLAAPNGAGTIQYPTLPVETVDYNAGATDSSSIESLIIGKLTGGYDVIRENILSLNGGPEAIAMASPSGSLTFQMVIDANQYWSPKQPAGKALRRPFSRTKTHR